MWPSNASLLGDLCGMASPSLQRPLLVIHPSLMIAFIHRRDIIELVVEVSLGLKRPGKNIQWGANQTHYYAGAAGNIKFEIAKLQRSAKSIAKRLAMRV